MTSIIIGQSQRDKETREPDDAIGITSGSEEGREKRPAMDLARSLPSEKRRHLRQAKDAERLGPNGTVAGTGSCFYPVMDTPRYRRIEST